MHYRYWMECFAVQGWMQSPSHLCAHHAVCPCVFAPTQDAEKAHKKHHAAQAGPKARKREEAVKKKKGTLEQSKKDHKNTRVRALGPGASARGTCSLHPRTCMCGGASRPVVPVFAHEEVVRLRDGLRNFGEEGGVCGAVGDSLLDVP